MADDAQANDCCFQWDIRNPFLPGRDLEATFYQGSPSITQWKLTLQLLDRGQQHWRYSVFLAFDDTNDDRSEIVAEKIRLSIELDSTSVFNHQFPNYLFSQSNRRKCYFGTIFFHYRRTITHNLKIKLDISLPRAARENEENCLVSNAVCLQNLSEDLGKLLLDEESPNWCPNYYRNLNLLSRNDPEPIRAHSYMLHARWNNFFRKHVLQNTVQTSISRAVLFDILKYIYTGKFGINWPVWTNHEYISELFYVINWYGLYHLYKVFVKSDLQQLRETRNPEIIQSHLYPLNFINGRQITEATHTWKVENNPELTFRLILSNENQAGPWLSYSLESRSSAEVHANVNLAVIKKRQRNDPLEEIKPFHELDHTIKPNETVESRCVLFLGCPVTFGTTEGTEINFYIQCYLSVTDGTTIDQIQNADDATLQNESVRLGILSDHMRQLQNERFGADMTISGRSTEWNPQLYSIHKGIFVGRWLEWSEGLENEIGDVPPEIPENPICILDSDSLSFVLDYMYTGRVFTVMYNYAVISTREIYEFASKSQFRALEDMILSGSLNRFSIDIIRPDLEPDYYEYRGRDGRIHLVVGGYDEDEDSLGDVARGVVVEEDLIGEQLRLGGIVR